jgi:hypothetical protein
MPKKPDHEKILTSVRGIHRYAEARDYVALAESLTRNLLLLFNEGVLTTGEASADNPDSVKPGEDAMPDPLRWKHWLEMRILEADATGVTATTVLVDELRGLQSLLTDSVVASEWEDEPENEGC